MACTALSMVPWAVTTMTAMVLVLVRQALQQFHPAHSGHFQVGYDNRWESNSRPCPIPPTPSRGGIASVSPRGDEFRQPGTLVFFVFNDQDFFLAHKVGAIHYSGLTAHSSKTAGFGMMVLPDESEVNAQSWWAGKELGTVVDVKVRRSLSDSLGGCDAGTHTGIFRVVPVSLCCKVAVEFAVSANDDPSACGCAQFLVIQFDAQVES